MALTTRCPNCRAAFKVVADQLRVRNGLVRCGSCGTVFDGRACLEGSGLDPFAPPASLAPRPVPPVVPQVAQPVPVAPPVPAPVFSASASRPAFDPPPLPSYLAASQAGSLLNRAPELPVASAVAPASVPPRPLSDPPAVLRGRDRRLPDPEPESTPESEPDDIPEDDEFERDLPVIRAIDPEDYPAGRGDEPEFTLGRARHEDDDDDDDGEPDHASVFGDVRTRYSSATDVGRAPPEFLDQDLIHTHSVKRRVWGWLCLLALLALGGQLAYVYRTPITIAVPALRPAFTGVCKAMGCKVSYARRIERIWIESASLRMTPANSSQAGTPVGTPTDALAGAPAAPDGPARMVLGAVLRNRYEKEQEWPALDLKLRDKSDTVIARKIIPPKDYLPPGSPGFMAPGAEVTVSVPIVVTGLQVNGYDLDKFFP